MTTRTSTSAGQTAHTWALHTSTYCTPRRPYRTSFKPGMPNIMFALSSSAGRLFSVATACVLAVSAVALGCSSDPEDDGSGLVTAPAYQPVPAPSQNPLPPGAGPRGDSGTTPPPPPPPPVDASVDAAVPDTAPPPADTGPVDAPTG